MTSESLTDDIVKRLRAKASDEDTQLWPISNQSPLLEEAADKIERLHAERDRWRKIADAFYEAGSNRSAHSEVAEAYEQKVRHS